MKLKCAVWIGVIWILSVSAFAQGNSSNTPAATNKPPVTVTDPTKPVHPSILVSSDPTKPPPFADVAGGRVLSSVAEDKATLAISPAVKSKLASDHSDWAKQHGAGSLKANLQFAGGHPILMLVTEANEPQPVLVHRLQATIEACVLHLAADAFDRTVICITEIDPKQPTKGKTRNVQVSRDDFEAAAKKCTGAANLNAALAKIRADDSAALYRQFAAALGLL